VLDLVEIEDMHSSESGPELALVLMFLILVFV
jgi:hypothetical protein